MSLSSSIGNEVEEIFKQCGALTTGHFVLRSGLHSGHYFQCARIGEDLKIVSRLAELLIRKIGNIDCNTVIAPAMGALVIGQEVARQMDKRFVFPEKKNDKLVLRRGFKFKPGERVLIIEDVVTKGGRVQETINIAKEHGATPVAVGILVDRSQGQVQLKVSLHSLFEMSYPTYEADKLPEELAAIPVTKPGS
jgi:orotate phosphoribosyltransferase